MVTIRHAAGLARAEGVLGPDSAGTLVRLAKSLFYADRHWTSLAEQARQAGIPRDQLEDWVASWPPGNPTSNATTHSKPWTRLPGIQGPFPGRGARLSNRPTTGRSSYARKRPEPASGGVHVAGKEILGIIDDLPAEDFTALADRLGTELWNAGVHFEGRPYPASPRPLVLSAEEAAAVTDAARDLHALLERVAALYREHADVREFFPRYAHAEHWLAADTGTRPDVFVCRFDGALVDGRFRIMETNTACPGGVIQNGIVHRRWAQAVSEELGLDLTPFTDPPQAQDTGLFVRRLVALHERKTGRFPESAAVVQLRGKYANEVDWISEGLTAAGVETEIADARSFVRSREGTVLLDGRRIDLAYNKLDQVDLIRTPEAVAYLDAAAAGDVTFVNGLLAQCVLNDKSVLALLTDERFRTLFGPAVQDVIDRHIPWTRRVSSGATTVPDGTRHDLAAYLRKDRARLIMKPADKTRGEGVVIGPFTDQPVWEAALDTALAAPDTYVVQRYLPLAASDLRPYSGGRRCRMTHGIDTYLFDGDFAAFQCRASLDPVVNIGKRGMLLPVVVEEARA